MHACVFLCVHILYVCAHVCVRELNENHIRCSLIRSACPGEEAGVSGAGGYDLAGQACNQTHELEEREQEEGGSHQESALLSKLIRYYQPL